MTKLVQALFINASAEGACFARYMRCSLWLPSKCLYHVLFINLAIGSPKRGNVSKMDGAMNR